MYNKTDFYYILRGAVHAPKQELPNVRKSVMVQSTGADYAAKTTCFAGTALSSFFSYYAAPQFVPPSNFRKIITIGTIKKPQIRLLMPWVTSKGIPAAIHATIPLKFKPDRCV